MCLYASVFMHVSVTLYNTVFCALKIYGVTQYVAFISCNLTKAKPVFFFFLDLTMISLVALFCQRLSDTL